MTTRVWFMLMLTLCVTPGRTPAFAQEPARPDTPSGAQPGSRADSRGDGWVVLPIAEYRSLRAKAFPADRPPDPPPVDAAITAVDYELIVNADGSAASGQARITVDVLKEGWVRIPMPRGLLIREARLDARPVALVEDPQRKEASGPELLLSKPGRALLTLDVVVPVTSRAGVEQLLLPASAAALLRSTITVPRSDVDVAIAGGFVGEQTKDAKATKVVAYGQAGQAMTLTWQRAQDNHRATLPLRARSTVTEVVGLGEDAAQVTVRVQIDIVQGVAPSVSLNVPAGFVVNEVSGALVSDWETKGATVAVTFLEPVGDRATFVLVGEFRPPREGQVAVPLVQVAQVERESGGVAVEVLGAGEITKHEARGLDPADPSDLGDALAGRDSTALVAFRYRAHEGQSARTLAVTVSRYTPQAVLLANVEEARYRVLLTEDGKALVEGRFAVRNNQRSFLGVMLPAGATLWSATIDGRATRPGRAADGTLLMPLPKSRAGGDAPLSAVQIVYLDRQPAWSASGQAQVKMPALDVPVSRTGVTLDYSPRFRVSLEPGAFRVGEEPEMPPALASIDSVMNGMTIRLGGAGVGGGVTAGNSPRGADNEGQSAQFAAKLRKDDGDGAAAREIDEERRSDDQLRGLVDRFQKESRGMRAPGVVPVRMAVPRVGTTLYLAAELTPERVAPEATLTYKREVK